jgi:hypothetical protein
MGVMTRHVVEVAAVLRAQGCIKKHSRSERRGRTALGPPRPLALGPPNPDTCSLIPFLTLLALSQFHIAAKKARGPARITVWGSTRMEIVILQTPASVTRCSDLDDMRRQNRSIFLSLGFDLDLKVLSEC